MGETFTDLADMCSTYLVCIGAVILNFIIFQPGSIFNKEYLQSVHQ